MTITINVELEIKMPSIPNFINIKDPKGTISIPVKDIKKEDLRKIGKTWTDELVKKGK